MNSKEFPILNRKISGRRFIYLNSAATSQKPKIVIDSLKDFYENYNSNVHRGLDEVSLEAERIFENSREIIANFINASVNEIVFTKSCTEALNLIARGLKINKGDKVVTTILEHHANFVPWKMLELRGVKVEILNVDNSGKIILDENKIKGAKVLAVTHLSNVLGVVQDIQKISRLAHKYGCLVVVDAAQSVGHMKVNVRELDCDFLVFSGHKMFSINGVGVLYGRKKLLEKLQPLLYGGDMINHVGVDKITFADLPRKLEAGTQDVAAIYSLAKSVEYINKIGIEKVENHIRELSNYVLKEMIVIPGLKIYGGEEKYGVISFNVKGLHGHDVAQFLADKGISVRAGHMCCQPLMSRLGVGSVVRVSLQIYNDKKDVDIFLKELKNCVKFFGGNRG